ncbi:hypothetical protein A2U01_0097657, partial [Trifolium medium]|nr:hypothetical protein [Trifolium medium]
EEIEYGSRDVCFRVGGRWGGVLSLQIHDSGSQILLQAPRFAVHISF